MHMYVRMYKYIYFVELSADYREVVAFAYVGSSGSNFVYMEKSVPLDKSKGISGTARNSIKLQRTSERRIFLGPCLAQSPQAPKPCTSPQQPYDRHPKLNAQKTPWHLQPRSGTRRRNNHL